MNFAIGASLYIVCLKHSVEHEYFEYINICIKVVNNEYNNICKVDWIYEQNGGYWVRSIVNGSWERSFGTVFPKDLKRTVLKSKSGRSKRKILDGLKQENWAVLRVESRRFKKPEVDGPTGSKRKVQ